MNHQDKGGHMHVRDEGGGRPLLLIHGWACPGQFFSAQTEALKAHARCIVPDLPGHGQTADRLPCTIEAAADALFGYLEENNLSDVVLCGWSMGAHVAYSLIERHGAGRVSAMVAVDMSPKVLNSEDWPNGTRDGLDAAVNEHLLRAIVSDWAKLPHGIALKLFAADVSQDPDMLARITSQIAEGDPVLLQRMWASLTAQDFRATLRSFPVPLHLAAGLQSQLYGPGVHLWHQELVPEFHLHAFEKSGHAPHLEERERFTRLLLDVIR